MNWVKVSSLILFSGVLAGAFGAHAIKDRLTEYSMSIWNTATLYLFVHGIALLVLGLYSRIDADLSSKVVVTQICFLVGIIIFSGSLYALALTDVKILGAITPIGGILFLVGWISLIRV